MDELLVAATEYGIVLKDLGMQYRLISIIAEPPR